MSTRLEIAATTLEEALRAVEGGADSLEVLRDLPAGGLTPPLDRVESIVRAVKVPINVIVRPTAETFHYNADQRTQIERDARAIAAFGVHSIVCAGVDPANRLDFDLLRRVIEAASPVPITVHRALDLSAQPDEAVAALVGVVSRVLTSGDAPTAWEGRHTSRRWIATYGSRIEFVLSGAITAQQIPELIAFTGAPVVHLGGAARTDGRVDVAKVRALKQLLETLGTS